MARQLSNDQVTGIVLVVLGALAIAGWLNAIVILVAGVALLVYGILILVGKAGGTQLVGILCIVGGIVLLGGYIPGLGDVVRVATIVVGVLLLVYGILKLTRK